MNIIIIMDIVMLRYMQNVGQNGRTSKVFVDPNVDLMKEIRGFSNKKWITKLEDEIKGF